MSIQTNGDTAVAPDGGNQLEDALDYATDYKDGMQAALRWDMVLLGFAVGLSIVLPEGQREVAWLIAALAGAEVADIHGRKKIPIALVKESFDGLIGLALGILVGSVLITLGLL